jgi:hypothetical protein
MSHHEGRPPHPVYGAPLSGAPRAFAGVVFRPYRAGVARFVLVSDDWRVIVWRHDTTWGAIADDRTVASPSGKPKRFRSERAACQAGVKLTKGPTP